jgi:hypothetical protein
MVGATGRSDRLSLGIVIVISLYLTFRACSVFGRAGDRAAIARQKTRPLHDVHMNALAKSRVIQSGDDDRRLERNDGNVASYRLAIDAQVFRFLDGSSLTSRPCAIVRP